WVDRPALESSPYQKFSFATAVRPGRTWGIGLGIDVLGSRDDRQLDGLAGVDLGVQAKPTDALAFGVALEDVNRPFAREEHGLPLRIRPAGALRLFDGRLTVESAACWAVRRRSFEVTPRVSTTPTAGLDLFARADIDIRPGRTRRPDAVLGEVTAGLHLQLGSVGLSSAVTARTGGKPGLGSTSHAIDVTPARRKTLVHAGERWVRIDLEAALSPSGPPQPTRAGRSGYVDVVRELRTAERADRIDGVLLVTGGAELGWGRAWELRQQLKSLHDADVTTVVLATAPDFESIYLASAADAVWTVPSSTVSLEGLHATRRTYAAALRSIGIQTEFVRIGEYKSSPERFVRERPSPESTDQTDELLDSLFRRIVGGIADGRGLKRRTVERAVDRTPLTPGEALDLGVIDATVYPDELPGTLRSEYDVGRIVDATASPPEPGSASWPSHREIAVVEVRGPIVQGRAPTVPLLDALATGSETIRSTLDALMRDPAVRAVVVRVDSPGGSAAASDAIFRKLRQVARHKPVVASMGNVAASGGYYVAAGADEIVATPNTTTGSIGIYAGKFSVHPLFAKIGVEQWHTDRGERAGLWSLDRSWSKSQRRAVAEEMKYLYGLFLEQVSQTRPLDRREIDRHGRGRVWIGSAAVERRLVDRTGGLLDAIRRAAELAGVAPSRAIARVYPNRGVVADIADSARTVVGADWRERPGSSPVDALVRRLIDHVGRQVLLPLVYTPGEPLMLPATPLPKTLSGR
ncbi:MAG: signal peptide peptidase SppA, partial [Bradymonadaceae bacterium]